MAITQTQSVTGRAGSASVNSVTIGITRWTAKIHRDLADATDSNNFDPSTGQTWMSQAEGVLGMEGTLEGNYDLGGSTDTNLTKTFLINGPFPFTFAFTRAVSFASCNADISDVEYAVSIPGATMITFTANWKSNGIITFV